MSQQNAPVRVPNQRLSGRDSFLRAGGVALIGIGFIAWGAISAGPYIIGCGIAAILVGLLRIGALLSKGGR